MLERVFEILKRNYGMGHAHYLVQFLNIIRSGVMCVDHIFRRGENIKKWYQGSHNSYA